ncbi:D-glycero-beta-D-manno-heptose 1,7-bisphosphate 7-phosphatase [Methylonatrum kenyense]|uniref:D-glycero-beta-D-manno-heptose 1,7-bisphosphate 7-phosphatase n=1 Tax=Methylonatrum kenyense TaxID=455253 RepID=UPI0020BFBF26|nr:D-glycero-beta-D-manno-heptose 1,7-bisphosphate 7-phosphatase [Methylonatrum kenyense]MCK8515264.1 D-glycero-beta-D-manno-heptose 1,7-bisphosphate 7-phosphatase [Methylonatrum kenyense]
MAARSAVFLDRDGVINRDSELFIRSVEEFQPLPGSLDAIRRLKQAGWAVVVCTNQSGVGRGLYSLATLDSIHAHLRGLLAEQGTALDGIYACPHLPEAGCACRKPRPGMLLQAAEELDLDLGNSFMVGDAARDLEAGIAAGTRPVLVCTGKGEETLDAGTMPDVPVFDTLKDFAEWLLAGGMSDQGHSITQ